ncbi:cbb3-type cytochrome c oxidase subunit 3 [Bdellovibrionota bacterium FG-1]
MMAEVVSKFPFPWLTCLGLFLFLTVFLGAVGWVFRKGSSAFYAEMSAAPLREQGVDES